MASIRKRGNSYLLVVSMGYTPDGRRRNPQQKTVKPPTGLTPKQTEKWLQEQAMIFEMSCKKLNPGIDRSITLEKYTEIWLQTIAPDKLAKSTLVREKQDIERFKPYLGSYKLVDLRPEHFRSLYAKLRKQKKSDRKAALRSDGRGCPQLPVRHPLRRDGGRLSRSQSRVAHLQIRRAEEREKDCGR